MGKHLGWIQGKHANSSTKTSEPTRNLVALRRHLLVDLSQKKWCACSRVSLKRSQMSGAGMQSKVHLWTRTKLNASVLFYFMFEYISFYSRSTESELKASKQLCSIGEKSTSRASRVGQWSEINPKQEAKWVQRAVIWSLWLAEVRKWIERQVERERNKWIELLTENRR